MVMAQLLDTLHSGKLYAGDFKRVIRPSDPVSRLMKNMIIRDQPCTVTFFSAKLISLEPCALLKNELVS